MSVRLRLSGIAISSLLALLLFFFQLASAQQDPASCSVSCRFIVAPTIGPPGLNGTDGPPGPTGANGQQGPPGERGVQGFPGIDGQNGSQGLKGDTGEQGPMGLDGPMGPQGPPGINGIDGINGTDGKNGADGKNGTDGKNGADATFDPSSVQTLSNKKYNHLVGGGSRPTGHAGIGAGDFSNIKLSATSTDSAGIIEITTGTNPAADNILILLEYATPYSNPPVVILTPANLHASSLTGLQTVYFQTELNTNAHFIIHTGTTPLPISKTFIWCYHVIG